MNAYLVVPSDDIELYFIVSTNKIPILNRHSTFLSNIAIAQSFNYESAQSIVIALNNKLLLDEHLNSLDNLYKLICGCLQIQTNSASVTLMLQTEILKNILEQLKNPAWFKINKLRFL